MTDDATRQPGYAEGDDSGRVIAFPHTHDLERSPANNLPVELSSFVGRVQEIADVEGALADSRLVTLTGPGGCGKTRLALEVTAKVTKDFEHGVCWVGLASLSEPDLVPQAVAAAVGVRETLGKPLLEELIKHLEIRKTLLVLDNCEHVISACATLVDTLLRACPDLKILATSREALAIPGERSWLVPSLSLPDSEYPPPVEELAGYEAIRLFVERAGSASHFELTERNAPAVAQLCQRLDGIPLAIELAAARARVLSAEQILQKLEEPLKLLTAGRRTADPRHQTLRATLQWGYDLLCEPERRLFDRLSVFTGGFTLEAVDTVGAGEGIQRNDALDLLSQLVDKSLVMAEAGGEETLRYRMLEPIRQYGLERLEESGEIEQVRERHARYYLTLAEETEPKLRGPEQVASLKRLETEHGNLRAALSWALEQGNAELGLKLGGALGEFWQLRGYLSEGRRSLEAALAKWYTPESARTKVLLRAGWIAWEQGNYEQSVALNNESLALSRKVGDKVGVAAALYALGWTALFGNELKQCSALIEEAMALQRELNDTVGVAHSIAALGMVAVVEHDYERAIALHEEALAAARKVREGLVILFSLVVGALAYLGRGEHRQTRELCEEGLKLSWQLRMMHLIGANLQVSAALAGSQGQPARSARLWGAAEALREAIGTVLSPTEHNLYERYIDAARSRLDEEAWEAVWAEGRVMTLEQAVNYALGGETRPPEAETSSVPSYPAGLSVREAEVLKQVARGLTNAQIAKELYISPNTVNRHLNSIYNKLGVSSRAAATRFAAEHGLV